jgi:adenylate cyclase
VHAAKSALQALASVTRARAEADARGMPGYSVKMGINTGPAVVGNVGAPGRYSYKAVGETVNIGARLEGVPDDYGCRIVVGPQTAAAIADRFVLCELDWIKVKGKEEAIAVYELLGEKSPGDRAERDYAQQYESALEFYRDGDFAAAKELWHLKTKHPHFADAAASPPLVMARRCAELLKAPPEAWDGVFVKTTK